MYIKNRSPISVEKAFGETLRTYRVKADMSQEELAHISELDRTFISLLERGLRQPSLSTIIQLAAALGIAATSLVSGTQRRMIRSVEKP